MDDYLPIIFVTVRDDMAAKKHGFHTGVDDYMVKPVELDELVLRVEALLRCTGIEERHLLKVGGLMLDAGEMSA